MLELGAGALHYNWWTWTRTRQGWSSLPPPPPPLHTPPPRTPPRPPPPRSTPRRTWRCVCCCLLLSGRTPPAAACIAQGSRVIFPHQSSTPVQCVPLFVWTEEC